MSILRPLSLVLLLLLLPTPTFSEIKDLQISDDSRSLILLEKFGFTRGGHVNVSVSSVSLHPTNVDPFLLGFFLLSDESLFRAVYDSRHDVHPLVLADDYSSPPPCVLSSPYVLPIFDFHNLSSSATPLSVTHRITHPDEYSLYFASCAPVGSLISMSVHTAMYNLNPRNGHPNFLSVGHAPLPTIYSTFATTYVVFLALWVYLCAFHNRPFTHRIHFLMALLLLAKSLTLLSAAEDLHYTKLTGTPHGWDVSFYIFQLLRGVLLFTVIVLIGTGWSFLKPYLQDREKKVLMAVIPLQVIANVASAVVGETGPFIPGWITWNQLFLVVDLSCCCAILFPIVWSIKTLKETSKTDGKAARNLAKLTLFRHFYVVVVGYLYFTRIFVFALVTISSYRYRWVSVVAEEAASLAFYAFVFDMFKPTERSTYFVVDEEEEEAAEMVLMDEEFEL